MSEITFQKADANNGADVAAYFALEKKMAGFKMYVTVKNEAEAKEELANFEVYFIKKADQIVGSTSYQVKSPNEVYLSGLLVDPDFHGQGIGRQAVEFRLEKLKDYRRLWLITHPQNSKIICLYLARGFVVEAWKDNYWGDGEPRLILAREKRQ